MGIGQRALAAGAALAIGLPLGITVAAGSAAAAPATTLYVATTGSDANPCTQAQPCATISHAVSVAPSGATVEVAAGLYDQSVVIEKPVTLVGQPGAVVNGWGRDPGLPLLGVVYIGGPGGTTASQPIGGNVTVEGLTFEDPNPDAQTYGDNPCLQPIIIGVFDGDPTDVITIADDHLVEGTDDPAAADDGPIGIDTLFSTAQLVVRDTAIQGVWQGMLLEDNGPSLLTGNQVTGLIPFDVPDTGTYLGGSPTEPAQCTALAAASGTTAYAPEGVALLADEQGFAMTDQTVTLNTFSGYAGDGVDVASNYYMPVPQPGSLSDVVIEANAFALGGVAGSGAVNLFAQYGGTVSKVLITGNVGVVAPPSKPITQNAFGGPPNGGTIAQVLEVANLIL